MLHLIIRMGFPLKLGQRMVRNLIKFEKEHIIIINVLEMYSSLHDIIKFSLNFLDIFHLHHDLLKKKTLPQHEIDAILI